MLTLEERKHQTDMAQVFKILTGRDRVDNEALFNMANIHGRNTRTEGAPLSLRQGAARLEVRKNFFTQRVVADWNKIPGEIKNLKSVQAFKSACRNLRNKQVHVGGDQ